MRPMPSPRGTNLEGLFLRDGPVAMALDEAPKRHDGVDPYTTMLSQLVGRIPSKLYAQVAVELGDYFGKEQENRYRFSRPGPVGDESDTAASMGADLQALKGKLPDDLFAKVQAALEEHYRDEFDEDLKRVNEQIDKGEAPVGDGLSRLLRVKAGQIAYQLERKRERDAAKILPNLDRIRVIR